MSIARTTVFICLASLALPACTTVVQVVSPPDAGTLDSGAPGADAVVLISPSCETIATRTDVSVHLSTSYTCSPGQLGSISLTMTDAGGTVGSLTRIITCPATIEVDFPTRPGPRATLQLDSKFDLDGGVGLDGGVVLSCPIQQSFAAGTEGYAP